MRSAASRSPTEWPCPFARAWLAAGLAYLPLGLAEFAAGPFWYHALYGGHAYRLVGSERWVGNRPLVFLEHGNELGTWAATAAVAAAWLWALGDLPSWGGRRLRIPGVVVVASLIAASLLWQSHGSIILMLIALTPLIAVRRPGGYGRWLIVAGVVLAIAAVAVVGAWAIMVGAGGVRDQFRAIFHGIGKSSFTWRLARIVENLPRLAERPILGWGRADWSRLTPDGTFPDPITLSFWFLVSGMYGAFGLLASAALLLLPIAASANAPPIPRPRHLARVLHRPDRRDPRPERRRPRPEQRLPAPHAGRRRGTATD